MQVAEGLHRLTTNEPDNHVIRFARGVDGELTETGRHATAGAGEGAAHLTSQGSIVLSEDLAAADAGTTPMSGATRDGKLRRPPYD